MSRGRAIEQTWQARYEADTRWLIEQRRLAGREPPAKALARLIEWDRERLIDEARD